MRDQMLDTIFSTSVWTQSNFR